MINRKGISDVIATVLIILITIAAIVILWQFVLPLINQNVTSGNCMNANLDQMKPIEDYTCINTANQTVTVQVSRGNNEYNLTDIQILLMNNNGVQKSFLVLDNTTTISPKFVGLKDLPGKNEGNVYVINYSGRIVNPVFIELAPVVVPKQVCEKSASIELKSC